MSRGLRILTVLVSSVLLHLLAALTIASLAHIVLFLLALLLVYLLVRLTRCTGRRMVRPNRQPKSVVPLLLFAPLLGLLKLSSFLALFLLDAAFLEHYMAPRQAGYIMSHVL